LDSGFIVEALVSEAEVEQLRREGYELKTIQDAEEVGRQRRKEME
jgi:hypothetical protein